MVLAWRRPSLQYLTASTMKCSHSHTGVSWYTATSCTKAPLWSEGSEGSSFGAMKISRCKVCHYGCCGYGESTARREDEMFSVVSY